MFILPERSSRPRGQEANMFATLSAARTAAAQSFASDHRISALYFEVAGREVRITRSEVAA